MTDAPVPVPSVPPAQLRALARDLRALGRRLDYMRRRLDTEAMARASTSITAARRAVYEALEGQDDGR